MIRVHSFPPLETPRARVLILGSMPGEASLRQREYYAHPRNAFWPIMAGLTGVGAGAAYSRRVAGLSACGIAVWDVLQSCERAGSLDSSIREHTVVPNAFDAFLRRHPALRLICFNGAKAEQAFRKHVLPTLQADHSHLLYRRLPSTSPAHAALSTKDKCRHWHATLSPWLNPA